jgi:hypothetical protein
MRVVVDSTDPSTFYIDSRQILCSVTERFFHLDLIHWLNIVTKIKHRSKTLRLEWIYFHFSLTCRQK